jgi:hypothetical protein
MSDQPETPQTPEAPETTAPAAPASPEAAAAGAQAAAEKMAVAVDNPDGVGAPDDADDLRGYHFKRLLSQKSTWIVIAVLMIVAGAAAGIYFKGAPIGGAAAGAVLVLSLIGVFAIADSRAEDAFFVYYAEQHDLALGGRSSLPEATPLLRKGDDRYAERTLSGAMGPGVEGILALYTYEEEHTDSDGNRETNYYRYTVGLVQIPECAKLIPELYVQRKFGFRALEGLEDKFRGKKERVKLESEALDKKYEIFVDEDQDANWVRQLFAPTFIVWLIQNTPDKFAFELVGGTLCCYANNHKEKSADLDRMRAATAAVATRIREEARE